MQFKIDLTFGLVSFPAKREGAIEAEVETKNLCLGTEANPHEPAAFKQDPSYCTSCGESSYSPVTTRAKGVKSGSAYALIDAAAAATEAVTYATQYKKGLSVVTHPAAEVEAATIPEGTTYYLTPADASVAGHYVMLARLVAAHPELAFVGLYTPKTKTSLWRLAVHKGALVMRQMAPAERMKPTPALHEGAVNEKLYALLEQSLSLTTEGFDPATYENGYTKALQRMVAESTEAVTLTGEPAEAKPTMTPDDDALIASLNALLEA